MAGYRLMSIWSDGTGTRLWSTAPSVVDWFLAEVTRLVPKARVQEDVLPSGEPYNCGVTRLNGRDLGIMWWVMQQLCQNGWEPYALSETGLWNTHFYLRLRD